jgi:hypothetical protein
MSPKADRVLLNAYLINLIDLRGNFFNPRYHPSLLRQQWQRGFHMREICLPLSARDWLCPRWLADKVR